jgi:hypothetical protein
MRDETQHPRIQRIARHGRMHDERGVNGKKDRKQETVNERFVVGNDQCSFMQEFAGVAMYPYTEQHARNEFENSSRQATAQWGCVRFHGRARPPAFRCEDQNAPFRTLDQDRGI